MAIAKALPGRPLPPELLRRRTDPEQCNFVSTADLPALPIFVGQERPIQAIRFGVKMDHPGYNIFALGPAGLGKYTLVDSAVQERAASEPPPADWCYVNNFDQISRPKVLKLPAGLGQQLRSDMDRLIEDMQRALSTAFESEEYQARRRTLDGEFQELQQGRLMELQEQAKQRGLTLLRTPAGLAFAPLKDENVLPPEEFEKLPEEEQKRIQADVEVMQELLQKVLAQAPRWERDLRRRLRELNREVASVVLNDLHSEIGEKYQALPEVLAHLAAVRNDVNEHLGDFLVAGEKKHDPADGDGQTGFVETISPLRRYQVNLLVDSSTLSGAPVIYESNPTYLNLTGRVEQMAQMGALITDFMLIKPGMLHRANGGYLILDALKVLTSPYAWEGLKRALQFGEIRIESAMQMLSLSSTISLEPEPVPLDVKVILMGDRMLYYLLAEADPDFNELFKVAADFADEVERSDETQQLYAQLIAQIVASCKLRAMDNVAVCRVLDHAARLVSDAEQMTTHIQAIVDLLQEADHFAAEAGSPLIEAQHVQEAIDARIYRNDRVATLLQREVLRGTILVATEGAVAGQINGLSVVQLGAQPFGQASRITATVRMGRGDVINIEREINMSGPSHSKGVLILASFLSARYALERPLSLSASLVFEQSYGGVDGDSASSTELYALLSAIGDIPIRQSLAVTGSVDQLGRVQAIGGVNEKIEGFFDLCRARGLSGDQGVLIPAANVKNLMLRQDVVDAVAAGQFNVYPVEHIDQGIELLTGLPAGERNKRGQYPKGTVNRLVEDRLIDIAKKRQLFERKGQARRQSALGKQSAGSEEDGSGLATPADARGR